MTDKKYQPSIGHTSIFLLVGLALLFGGAYIAFDLLNIIEAGIVYIFILFLPAPMIVFGLLAISSAFRQEELPANDVITKMNGDKSTQNAPIKNEVKLSNGGTHTEYVEKQALDNTKPENENPSWGSMLTYLFIILGILLILIVSFGTFALDIRNGVTQLCSHGVCHDTYLKDSPIFFYISLAMKTVMALVIPALLVVFIKKWIDE